MSKKKMPVEYNDFKIEWESWSKTFVGRNKEGVHCCGKTVEEVKQKIDRWPNMRLKETKAIIPENYAYSLEPRLVTIFARNVDSEDEVWVRMKDDVQNISLRNSAMKMSLTNLYACTDQNIRIMRRIEEKIRAVKILQKQNSMRLKELKNSDPPICKNNATIKNLKEQLTTLKMSFEQPMTKHL